MNNVEEVTFVNKYMSVDECAKLMRIHVMTTYQLLKKNKIPGAMKLGGQWRINREIFDRETVGTLKW